MKYEFTVAERFLRYVQIDTQSDPTSNTFPTTEKQKDLSRLLVEELLEMGIEDAEMDEHGYVFATIPSNTDKDVPTICFCSHVDTAPDCSGTNVQPIIHENYQGGEIELPDDDTQIIKPEDYPHLKKQIGNSIITTRGTTLLGADDKAGVAEIMDAANYLMTHPKIKHGKIRILFTPDEEVGKGVDKLDMEKLGADFGYTLDGGVPGTLEDETFSADGVTITINGVSVHPGYAKGKMENAMKIAAAILDRLPKHRLTPEVTEKKQGFIHPVSMEGILEKATLKFIIRDFTTEQLQNHEAELKAITDDVLRMYPNSSAIFEVKEQYRNMKVILDQHPDIIANAEEAIRKLGYEPKKNPIRGGTDGSRLSFMGLPCPNIFTGMQAIHSVKEWVSIQDMEEAVQMIVHICQIWEEKA